MVIRICQFPIPNVQRPPATRWRRGLYVGIGILSVLSAGCAARRVALPADPGSPLNDFAQVHEQISQACRGVRVLTAELALDGQAGGQRIRGRIHAGFEQPSSMRLEGVAPFGAPAFILVARGEAATLLLPRDERVLRDARPEELLDALTGIMLAPADLQAILTGCVVAAPRAVGGRLHSNGWASIDLGAATLYLEPERGGWRVRAARRGDWQIEYSHAQGPFPSSVRLRSLAQKEGVDLTAAMSQLETNVNLDPAAFTVSVPPRARPLTLAELRQNRPL